MMCVKQLRNLSDYFNDWAQQDVSDRMYPFSETFCDISEAGNSIVDNIQFSAPFYGEYYNFVNVRNFKAY